MTDSETRPETQVVRETRRRETVIEFAIAAIAVLVTTTSVGVVLPAIVRRGPIDWRTLVDDTNPMQAIMPILIALIGTLVIASLLAVVLVEKRRPWPFGPRMQRPRQRHWETLPAIVVGQVTGAWIVRDRWTITELRLIGDEHFWWIGIPAGVAATFVAWFAAFSPTYVVAHMIRGAVLASRSERALQADA